MAPSMSCRALLVVSPLILVIPMIPLMRVLRHRPERQARLDGLPGTVATN